MKFNFRYGNQSHSIDLEPQPDGKFVAQIGEKIYKIDPDITASGEIRFQIEDQNIQATSAIFRRDGGQHETHVTLTGHAARTFELIRADSQTKISRAGSAESGSLRARMPGQVTRILVAQGDRVEAGQALLILEAMKMETRITAPAGGMIVRLLVEQGQTVERDQLLIEIESDLEKIGGQDG
jgi:biotin carboxyl carrier protein